MSFHRNIPTEIGLIPQTRKILANPVVPFEFEKHNRICTELFKERSYSQRYYIEVYKPRQEAIKAEKAAAKRLQESRIVRLPRPQQPKRKVTQQSW